MLGNYGIKRMLPRLIVAAILVNVSFWICALAVDISNLLGASIYNILDVQLGQIVVNGNGNNLSGWGEVTGWLLGGGIAGAGIAGAALTVGAYGFLGALALLIPAAITALIAFLTAIFLLITRQALVIMLIVLSPLAFVAYLLPNTEEWFNKWRKLFFTMLLLYPSIALLFGGAQLAAQVIRNGTNDALVYIASLVIGALPLFMLVSLMRASNNIMGKVAGIANNPNRGPLDRARKAGARYTERQKNFRFGGRVDKAEAFRTGSKGSSRLYGAEGTRRRRARAWVSGIGSANKITDEEKDKYAKVAADAAHRNYVAERASTDRDYATSLGGGSEEMGNIIESYAIKAKRDEEKKDIEAIRTKIAKDPTGEYRQGQTSDFVRRMTEAANRDGGGAEAAAFAAEIAKRGAGEQFQEAMVASQQIQDKDHRRLVQQELIENMREPHFGVSDTMRSKMATGDLDQSFTITDASGNPRQNGNGTNFSDTYYASLDQRLEKKLSAEAVVSLKPHDMNRTKEMIASGELTNAALQSMMNNMASAESNENTRKEIKGETEDLFNKAKALAAARGITVTNP